MPSLVVIGPQIKEKQMGAQCPPQPNGSKSLNKVKAFYITNLHNYLKKKQKSDILKISFNKLHSLRNDLVNCWGFFSV